jgi:flagella basal body P-ring formation protein FlgA
MQGEALRDGAVGEAIGVRNLSSQRVVEGRVTAEGAVEIAM